MTKFARFAAFMSLSLLLPLASAHGDEFPGVKGLMSDDEFRRSGLNKLSSEELQALDSWLLHYTVGEAPVLKESNEAVKEADKNYGVESTLSADFSGWSGDTVFRLENGQVWRQRLDGRYQYSGAPNPAVRIDKNWLGFYRMTLVKEGRSIGVTRVR